MFTPLFNVFHLRLIYLPFFFISILCLSSCSQGNLTANDIETSSQTYWINSAKKACVGVAPMQCLQVQKGLVIENAAWQLFYAPINGFNYQPGFIYQIKVKEETLPSNQVPADGSSIRYSLIEILKKKADERLRLNDIWALQSINKHDFTLEEYQTRPQLEIKVSTMSVNGTDGCNRFHGQINKLNESTLIVGPMASTRRMCIDMAITDKFNQALGQVKAYTIESLSLVLLDLDGKELLRFKKID